MLRGKTVLACAATMLALALSVSGQKTKVEGPKYDPAKEVTFKGTVEEIQEVPNAQGPTGVHLMVKTNAELMEVRLCPHTFLKEFAIVFNKGDQLTVTGSKVRVGEKDVVLAREIEMGNNKIVLRDKDGAPAWTWLVKAGGQ